MTEGHTAGSTSAWAGRKVLVLSPTPTHPLDCGNRRRIYFVCRRIKQLGGEIHFLHYPSEEEWATALPVADQHRMVAEWDAYYVAPVTRQLYTPPQGVDHTIDEWWDPGIGQMLDWLFRVQSFDVFIVNYVWLSKAFEHAPAGVVKIIDTHDRFSDRRTLFEAHGIEPDYFHIREDDERIGIGRADLVWAIKSEEEAEFRRLGGRPVLTLVHAEPVAAPWPKRREAILRFGITGSANEFNIRNFRNFLEVAAWYIRHTLLPCEIVLGGACCERLADLDYPFVRQLGRLDDMDAFYDAVDVILGPMSFSTGLKIRIGEALARGKAIVAHRHCFEGYAPAHPFHTLPSFEAMMQACRDIVRAPQLVDDLELASVEAMKRALRSVDRTLEATLPVRRAAAPGLVFVLDLDEVWEGSLVLDHAIEAAQYLAHHCDIEFFLDGAAGAYEAGALARLSRLGAVLLSPQAAAALAPAAAGAMRPAAVISFEALLRSGRLGFWFASLPFSLPTGPTRIAAPVFLPVSVLALRVAESRLSTAFAAIGRAFTEVVAMDGMRSRLLAAASRHGAATHIVPNLWCADLSDALKAMTAAERTGIVFFTPVAEGVLFDLVSGIARDGARYPVTFVYDDRRASPRRDRPPRPKAGAPELIPLVDYVRRVCRGEPVPELVVELGECSAFGILTEVMDRAGVPRLSLFDPGAARPAASGRIAGRVGGVVESALVLAEWLGDATGFAELGERGRTRYRALDPGWTILWDRLADVVSRRQRRPAAAANGVSGYREIGAEIVLYTEARGDCRYRAPGWVGERGSRHRIEAFGIRPLEAFAPGDIEYKALGPNGRETPWVSDAALCGSRGAGVPLTGFAIRLAPHLRERFEVVYEGAFVADGIVGPSRNGEPCVAAVADDPLEAIRVRLLERAAS